MTQDKPDAPKDVISSDDMNAILRDEVQEVMKAADLRIREIAAFTTAYAAGKITPEEATDKYMEHMDKWGDALPGVIRPVRYLTDEEITADMEKAVGAHTRRTVSKRQNRTTTSSRGSD